MAPILTTNDGNTVHRDVATKGVDTTQMRTMHGMLLNAVISRHPLSSSLSQMLIRHITMHLEIWSASVSGAKFRISTIGDLIYLQTNSSDLLEMYVRYEQSFVEYIIADELQAAEEAYMWLETAA